MPFSFQDTSRRTPEDQFRDDDFDSGFGAKKSTTPSTSSYRDNGSAISESKSQMSKPPVATGPKVKKPIDLGAAAAFAAANKQQSVDPAPKYSPIVADLFAADDTVHTKSHNNASNLSFDADDFDPRDSANANGSFGDFSAAFSAVPTSDIAKQDDDGDDFADFSSAFGGTSKPAPPAFTAAPAPASAPMFDLFSDAPAPEKVSTFDLLSGLDMGGVGQMQMPVSSNNFGGLSGLNFSPPPPLIGAQNVGSVVQPLQPQSGSFFDFNSQAPSSSTSAPQPSNNNNSNINNFAKKPTTWDTVAGVNIDLDNLKLGSNTQKKPALPMNALMTPNSSPTKGFPNQAPNMIKPSNVNNLL